MRIFNLIIFVLFAIVVPDESKKRPAPEMPLLPEDVSNDIWQYLIEQRTCSIILEICLTKMGHSVQKGNLA